MFHATFNVLSACMGHNNETKHTEASHRADKSHSTHSQRFMVCTYRWIFQKVQHNKNLSSLRIPTYKATILSNNTSFTEMFMLRKHVSPYNTKHTEIWFVPTCKTSYSTQSLSFHVPSLLNKYCIMNMLLQTLSNKQTAHHFVEHLWSV